VSRLSVSNGLDETQDSHAALAARKLMEGLQQAQRLRVGQQRAPVQVRTRTTRRRAAVEQGRQRHAKRAGDLREPARADAVRAVLVFLDLLERHVEVMTELGLGQAALQAADSDVSSHQSVDG